MFVISTSQLFWLIDWLRDEWVEEVTRRWWAPSHDNQWWIFTRTRRKWLGDGRPTTPAWLSPCPSSLFLLSFLIDERWELTNKLTESERRPRRRRREWLALTWCQSKSINQWVRWYWLLIGLVLVWVRNRKQREERRFGSFARIAVLLNFLIKQRDFARNVMRNEEG